MSKWEMMVLFHVKKMPSCVEDASFLISLTECDEFNGGENGNGLNLVSC